MDHRPSTAMRDRSDAEWPFTAEDFRARDWGATALGPAEGWNDLLQLWVQFMLGSAQPMAIVWEPEQTFLFNAAYCHLIGPRFREALGQPLAQLRADIWDRVESFVAEVRAGRSGVLQNIPLRTWSANLEKVRDFSIAYSPIQSLDGEVAGALLTYTDTTDHVHREQILRERDMLHELFEQAPGFIAMVEGPDHRYTLSNAANNRLLGRSDVVGKTVLEAFPELAEQGVIAVLDKVYATGIPFIAHGLPFTIRREDGPESDTHYIDTIYQPIRDATKQVIGIFAEGHDVTAHHLAQARVQALQTDLIHVSRASAMDAMASTMAHELNQPLASISNYMEAARRMVASQPANGLLVQCLEEAANAAVRAGKIIRNLRDMTIKGHVTKSELDLEATVKEAMALVTLGNPGITVSFNPGTVKSVLADAVQIQQVVINLVRNAFEASTSGHSHIEISVCSEGRHAEVCVRDDGPGIPEDLLPNLFESFTSTKERGMGVGLSICRAIIEGHGGRIWAENCEGGGAIVCFKLDEAGAEAEA